MVISWLFVLCVASVASALPVSVVPVRQYVLLAPELPKFTLQPTLKVQAPTVPAPVQQVSAVAKPDPSAATKQYVVVYPSYQYVTRQDESSNTGFFETIQNYFVNFGNNNQNDDTAQIMDSIEPDKPEMAQAQTAAQSTRTTIISDASPEKAPIRQKIYYSYLTPASTLPLNADRRIFYLAEQPQMYGSFGNSAINPVYNLQPVPVVLSRSNQAVAQPDDSQPNKVITENVQKFSQIPPVMANVEQVPDVQSKSGVVEQSQIKSLAVDPVEESKVAPVVPAQSVVPVEENRSVPVSTEPSVEVKPAVVVEARSNAIPLTVSSEFVAPVAPAVATPVVDGHIEGNESVQPAVLPVGASLKEVPSVVSVAPVVIPVGASLKEVPSVVPVAPVVAPVGASLKEVPSAVPVAPVDPVVPVVPDAVDQTVHVSDKVESATISV